MQLWLSLLREFPPLPRTSIIILLPSGYGECALEGYYDISRYPTASAVQGLCFKLQLNNQNQRNSVD